jgi:hypothetical protein
MGEKKLNVEVRLGTLLESTQGFEFLILTSFYLLIVGVEGYCCI